MMMNLTVFQEPPKLESCHYKRVVGGLVMPQGAVKAVHAPQYGHVAQNQTGDLNTNLL